MFIDVRMFTSSQITGGVMMRFKAFLLFGLLISITCLLAVNAPRQVILFFNVEKSFENFEIPGIKDLVERAVFQTLDSETNVVDIDSRFNYNFYPNDPILAVEFAVIASRVLGIEKDAIRSYPLEAPTFEDVRTELEKAYMNNMYDFSRNFGYLEYVQSYMKEKYGFPLIDPDEDGNVDPLRALTKIEVVKGLVRLFTALSIEKGWSFGEDGKNLVDMAEEITSRLKGYPKSGIREIEDAGYLSIFEKMFLTSVEKGKCVSVVKLPYFASDRNFHPTDPAPRWWAISLVYYLFSKDPEKIEDNAMLYAKLGVSIQDVIAGNVDMANLTPKFKELGEQIKGMSVMAGSALAKQLGMSRRELVAMADIDLTKGMGGKEGLEGMFKKSLSPQEKMQKMMNDMQVRMTEFADTLQNKIMDIIPKIEGMINKIMGLFGNKKMWIAGLIALVGIIGVIAMAMRKKFYAVAEDFKKTLTTATEEAIVMGTEKAAKVAETGIATRGGKTSKMQRIISSEQYKQVQGVAEMFDVMAKSNLFPSVRRMTENTADWLRTISMGSKKVSLLKILSEENYKSIKETLEARKQENAMLSNVYEDRKKELEDRIKIYQIRMEEVKGTKEAVWLNKQIAKMTNETGRLQDKINQTERNTEQLQEKFLRKVGKEQLADMYKQLELEKTRQQGLLEANKQRRAELRIQNELLSREAKALTNRRNELQTSDNLTAEQAMELEKINSVLNEINGKRKAIVAEGKESLLNDKEALEQIQKINDEMTDIKKAAGGTDLSKVGKSLMPEGPIKRITNFVGSVFHKAGSGITNAFDKARKSAKQMGTDIVEKLKPTNWLKSIKAKLRGFGDKEAQENAKAMTGVSKGMGKLGGLMKKLAIPMMIMGLVMKAIQPIIETLQPILKTIVDVIGDVLKDLAKKLLPPILRLLAKFFPMIVLLVNKLLPPILWLLGQIVKILGMLVGAIGTLLQGMLTLPIKIAAGIDKIMHPLKYRGKSADEIAQEKIEQLRETSPLYKAAFGFTDVVKELGTEIGSIGDEIIGTGKYYMKHDIITKEAQDKIVGAMEKAADNIEKGNFAKKEETAGTAAAAAAPSAGSAALFVAGAGGTITKESDAKKAEAINAKKTAENTEKSAEAEQVQVNIMQEQNETLKKLNNTMAELLNYMKRKDIPTVGATPTAATVS